jgi:hypothetical protein
MREVHPGTVVTVNRTGHGSATTARCRPACTRRPATSIATVRSLLDDIVAPQLGR